MQDVRIKNHARFNELRVPFDSEFANERAARRCELRDRGTSLWSPVENRGPDCEPPSKPL
jgi:hypothetical protein